MITKTKRHIHTTTLSYGYGNKENEEKQHTHRVDRMGRMLPYRISNAAVSSAI